MVSALGRFGLGRFGLGRFGHGSFRPNYVGRFGLFFSTIRLVTEGQLNTLYMFRPVGECMGLAEALGWFKHIEHEQRFSVNNS